MLALKKKREAEAKAKAEAEAAAASAVQTPGTAPSASSSTNKVSLLGIGGKKKKTDGSSGPNGTKKRSPGEIRIQKGERVVVVAGHILEIIIG